MGKPRFFDDLIALHNINCIDIQYQVKFLSFLKFCDLTPNLHAFLPKFLSYADITNFLQIPFNSFCFYLFFIIVMIFLKFRNRLFSNFRIDILQEDIYGYRIII